MINELLITETIYKIFGQGFFLNWFWTIITTAGIVLLISFFIFGALIVKKKTLLIWYLSLFGFGYILKEIISWFYIRTRPYTILNLNIKKNLTDSSFYSMHTYSAILTTIFIFYLTENKSVRISSIILTILIIFSRLVLAQHYISDILVSILLVLVLYLVFRKFYKKEKKEIKK